MSDLSVHHSPIMHVMTSNLQLGREICLLLINGSGLARTNEAKCYEFFLNKPSLGFIIDLNRIYF